MTNRKFGLIVAVSAFAIDQISKSIALASTSLQGGVEVYPIFNLVLVYNRGVSFGLFAGDAPWWILANIGLAMSAVLLVWMWREQGRLQVLALGLLIGGALANVLDRFRHGAVIDFLDFHVAGYHWPAFNLADVAVVSGASILVAATLLVQGGPGPNAKDS